MIADPTMGHSMQSSVESFPSGAQVSSEMTLPILRRYGTALSLVAVALILTLQLQHFFSHPFLFLFLAAVMVSAWFGGTSPGLLAVCLSTFAVDYFLVSPIHSLKISAPEEAYFVAFIVCALGTSLVGSLTKKSEVILKETCNQLQFRVAERSAELDKTRAQVARLENEISELSKRLEARKLVERAKGVLQRIHKISENDAYIMLQSQSRKRNKPMKEIAEAVLMKDEIERGKG